QLQIETPAGPIVQGAPLAWQVGPGGQRFAVSARFRILGDRTFGFAFDDERDSSLPTVIDPGISWGTYLGGFSSDSPAKVLRLPNGNVLISGGTFSPDFPVTPGAYEQNPHVTFITCFDSTASQLVFSTFFGGSGDDTSGSLLVDANGDILLAGYAQSTDLPTTPGALSSTYGGGLFDGFVAMLSPDGSTLLYSTYLSGSCNEGVNGLALDSSGLIIAAGGACSADFPPGAPGTFHPAITRRPKLDDGLPPR